MNDFYIFFGVAAGCWALFGIGIWFFTKAAVLDREDDRDQEAHEVRLKNNIYER